MTTPLPPYEFTESGRRFVLRDPSLAPTADAFLWNPKMLLQITCRGYAWGQTMQPDSTVYAYPPSLLAKTFMQPEPRYFAHHPGRFFYVRDDATGKFFSAPHDPVRAVPEAFEFAPGLEDIAWTVRNDGLQVSLRVLLPSDDTVELWTASVVNVSRHPRKVSLYPYFPVGYASWMNMAGEYDAALHAAVCPYVTPYQQTQDYYKNLSLKEITFLASDAAPDSWELAQQQFEGEGGLGSPDALRLPRLARGEARFEPPACVFQYRRALAPGKSLDVRLMFGPARDRKEIGRLRRKYFAAGAYAKALRSVHARAERHPGCLHVETEDEWFDHFVNHWLPRQIGYLGHANRLTTDPQTRNFLQDAMGMNYVDPVRAREIFVAALSQQQADGREPDGILLAPGAELKYINTIPHGDHCSWLPICIGAYLDETGDYDFLREVVPFADRPEGAAVHEHVCRALQWLLNDRSPRGLSRIGHGDWCDPMNMVGPEGRGESAMLSEALAYGLRLWARFSAMTGDGTAARWMVDEADCLNELINRHYWDGQWYARGYTDAGRNFGVRGDREGKIFLNSQTFALLCGAATGARAESCIRSIQQRLGTGYGPLIVAPAYTRMREDVGRMTQKHPGSDVNGSVYTHAAAFYIFALYAAGRGEAAFDSLRALLPGPDANALRQSEQLPLYVPNYYRGNQFPRQARVSSHMPHSGAANWMYRSIVEGLFGLVGTPDGLLVRPQLPPGWNHARAVRMFRGATLEVDYRRAAGTEDLTVLVDGREVRDGLISAVRDGRRYRVEVLLPDMQNR
jgi:cellobionic acid phosphorylase